MTADNPIAAAIGDRQRSSWPVTPTGSATDVQRSPAHQAGPDRNVRELPASAERSQVVRVVLGDDKPLFLMGVRVALDADPAVEVVGEGVTAADIVALCRDLLPDLVLTDVPLPGMAFGELLSLLSAMAARPHLLIMTAMSDAATFSTALCMGVRGYLPKNASSQEVRQAVRIVASGGSVFGSTATGWLESALTSMPGPQGAEVLPALSQREREVLELLCRGADNRYIARSLFIAEKTVRNHVSNIFTKLGVTHRAGAAARARDAGLGGRDRIGTPAPCARDIRQMTLSPAAHIRISNAPRRS